MTYSPGVLVDNSVVLRECFKRERYTVGQYKSPLFKYFVKHPGIGLIAEESVINIENRIRKTFNQHKRKKAKKTLQYMVENHLKEEKVSKTKLNRKIPLVEKLFRDIFDQVDGRRPRKRFYRSSKYSQILRKMEKPIGPETEDKYFLCEALILSENEDYSEFFVASEDSHLIGDEISKEIENRFGIFSSSPKKVLSRLTRY